VLAVAENGVIGRGNALPWRLPTDLRRFKALTMGHPVIMGRKTWDSIRKPLPGRRNLVVTRNPSFTAPGAEVRPDLASALAAAADGPGAEEVFVVGGAEIYRLAMPLADRIHLTLVHARPEGDAFFSLPEEAEWRLASTEQVAAGEGNEFPMEFRVYERKGLRTED